MGRVKSETGIATSLRDIIFRPKQQDLAGSDRMQMIAWNLEWHLPVKECVHDDSWT